MQMREQLEASVKALDSLTLSEKVLLEEEESATQECHMCNHGGPLCPLFTSACSDKKCRECEDHRVCSACNVRMLERQNDPSSSEA